MTLEQIVTDQELSQELKDAGMEGEILFAWYGDAEYQVVAECRETQAFICSAWTLAELLAHPLMESSALEHDPYAARWWARSWNRVSTTPEAEPTPTQAAGKLLLALLKKPALPQLEKSDDR